MSNFSPKDTGKSSIQNVKDERDRSHIDQTLGLLDGSILNTGKQ